MIRPAAALVLTLALGACEQSVPPKKSAAKERMDADAVLLKDIASAGLEFERRLTTSISVEDGLLIVRDPIMGKFELNVMPANSPWVISCGYGLSVVLGTTVSGISIRGENTNLGNDIQLQLTEAKIDQKDCDVLGRLLGKRLKIILQGDQSLPR